MRLFVLPIAAAALLSACQTTPNSADTSNALLKFRVHYQSAALATPYAEIATTTSKEAGTCLFVASPFGVAANAADSDGIRTVVIGPSAMFDALIVRQQPGDTVALPGPSVHTTQWQNATISNPGTPPGTAVVFASYNPGKTFDTVNVLGTYEFAPGHTLAALHATVHNFGATTGVSEVYNFYVRPASAKASEQPGMPCTMP